MREILFFSIGASITLAVFIISLIELLFTIHRRKANQVLAEKVKALKFEYNNSINELVLKDDAVIEETEKKLETISASTTEEKKTIELTYQEKIDKLTKDSTKALESAKARAKKLEHEAKIQADEYLKSRQKEVEEELMNLVISVTKKVLPEGISYDGQKKLVMNALRDIKAGPEGDPRA